MTRGRDALLSVLTRTTGRAVAERCRVSPSRVSEWASGLTKPSARARQALSRNYRIRPGEWDVNLPIAERIRIRELVEGVGVNRAKTG